MVQGGDLNPRDRLRSADFESRMSLLSDYLPERIEAYGAQRPAIIAARFAGLPRYLRVCRTLSNKQPPAWPPSDKHKRLGARRLNAAKPNRFLDSSLLNRER